MNKRILGIAGAALALLAAAPAAAIDYIYTSLLEYSDKNGSGPFGKVTLQQINPNTIFVQVTLLSPEVGFLNTGGPHEPFLFNLTGDYKVTTYNSPGQEFVPFAYDSNTSAGTNYTATPYGNFTNKIGCCNDKNGGANADPPPLTFTVKDTNLITIAGVGATFDPTTGKLVSAGTGDRFLSNSGGWWLLPTWLTTRAEPSTSPRRTCSGIRFPSRRPGR